MPIYNNILAGSSGQGGYEIEQSLRFEDGDNAYLSRTNGTPTDNKINTLSFWLKRGNITTSGAQWFFSGGNSGWRDLCGFNSNNDHFQVASASSGYGQTTDMVFRDVGAWYHIVVVYDTTEALNDNRIKIYVNGSQVTTTKQGTVPLNQALGISVSGEPVNVGRYTSATPTNGYGDGYLAECHFIDGQALDASYFGKTDPVTNKWIPKKYLGTYGNIGWYLTFSDSASLGADSSGNGNNFTPTNLAATDQVLDSPTNNFCTFNPLDLPSPTTLRDGNLVFVNNASTTWKSAVGTMATSSGKYYAEFTPSSLGYGMVGIVRSDWNANISDSRFWGDADGYAYYSISGVIYNNNLSSAYGATYTNSDVIGVALDLDAGTLTFYKNNVSQGTAATGLSGEYKFAIGTYDANNAITVNFGQDSSFAGNKTAQNNTDANGIGDFYYAPPSGGYLALCTANLSDPSIADPTAYFNTVLYTGDGSASNSITGVGFQPDFTWLKSRSISLVNGVSDSVRGGNAGLIPNLTTSERINEIDGYLSSFDSDGFTLIAGTNSNNTFNWNANPYVSWNWKADNTSGSSNTDGTITSTVSANTTAGFSIVTYTGNLTAGATVGHGLTQAPEMIIVKDRDNTYNWQVYHKDLTTDYSLLLNTTAAPADYNAWNNSSHSATTFTLGAALGVNTNAADLLAYCFHSVEGYSKFGSYTGNGSTDGTFVYTGFKPAFVIIKRTDVSGDSWFMFDTARDTFNPLDSWLGANLSNTEGSNTFADSLSNGFKLRGSISAFNASGGTYIYMAFAESPFKYSNAR
jgi:hypothetical protein